MLVDLSSAQNVSIPKMQYLIFNCGASRVIID